MGRDWEEKRDRRRKGRSKKMNARSSEQRALFFFFNGGHTAGKHYSLEAFSVTVYLLFFLFAFWAFT